jgi:Fur family ferric uptake transcriptional regulator
MSGVRSDEELYRIAIDYLRAEKSKLTPPREAIIRTSLSFAAPFHAEQLLAAARLRDRLISVATVYRLLPLLVKSGVLREIDLKHDSHQHYEVNRAPTTGHIVCQDCQQVIEVQDACLTLRENFVANSMGFTPTKLSLRIEAACQDLHEKGHCPRQDGATP